MSEIKTIKTLIPEDEQYEIIDKIINEEFDNQTLTDALTSKFKEKGFPIRLITLLFGGEQDWVDLPELAKVAFIDGASEGFKKSDKNEKIGWTILNDIDKWFENNTLVEYDAKVNELKPVDSILIKNMTQIDDLNYVGYISYETIYNAFNNSLLVYNKEAQRQSTYRQAGTTGKKLREITLNNTAVEEIKKEMIAGTYEQDMIIYNVLLTRQDIIPQVTPTKKFDNIYDLEIIPNYDRKSKNYTIVNIADGYHRTVACVRAYSECLKRGNKLEGGLPIKITMRNLQGAKKIIDQTFKRTDADSKWLDTLSDSDYNDFVDLLIKTSKVLNKGKVSRTFEECDATNSLTYSYILSKAIERYATNIQVNAKLNRKMVADKMANIIDELFDYFIIKFNDMETIKNETHLASVNIFIGYLAVANEIRLVEDYENLLIKIADKIIAMPKEDIEFLKLTWKDLSVKKIYDYFKNMAREVIKVEE